MFPRSYVVFHSFPRLRERGEDAGNEVVGSPPLMCPDIFCEIFSDDKSDTSTSG